MADSEKIFNLKRQLRKLEAYHGNGTELITVYIPAGSPIHEMNNKLREEASQASNIKSKSTKLAVLGALERISNHFKLYKRTPPNGLAVFCGNVSDNAAKVDIQLFALEPPEPLNIGAYRCDSRFFLDPLQQILGTKDAYGVVVMDGREATVAIVKGTNISVIKRLNSTAHAKIRKGGQCLAAGTLLIGEDGGITDIEDFKAGSGTVGLDMQAAKTVPVIASDFFVTPATHSLVIRTKHPMCEIRATLYHRFFVISEHGIKEKFAKDLGKEDRILIARKINCDCGSVKTGFVPKTRMSLDDGERRRLREARQRLGFSQQAAARKIGLSQMVISHMETGKQTPSDANLRRIYKMYGLCLDESRLNRETLRLPEYWDEYLARLCGVLCGDGTADGNRTIIYEGSRELAEKYCMLVERAIDITPTLRTVDKTGQRGSFAKKPYYEIRIYSLAFAEAIAKIAPEVLAAERDIPAAIARCGNDVVAAFLSGLYDAEGYIHGNRVDIAMTSRKLMKKLQFLLLRFGILSSFAEKRVSGSRQWFVSISDRNSLRRFMAHIGFARSDKKQKLLEACKKQGNQQYIDQIPIDGREVLKLAQGLGLKTSDFHAASCFFRNRKPLGRETFAKNILPVFDRCRNTEKGRKTSDYLRRIYDSNFTFAVIKEKIPFESRENFYDITIPIHSNFIADGFVVHNSARRYERLIEEAIEVYYKRVGDSMDNAFLGKVKGVIVGGPGPTKEFFMKMSPFNYQIKVLGVVDTGYTDDYGIREVLSKSENIISQQETIKEKILVDRFIKAVVNEGLAVYGEQQVREAIASRQAEKVLLSEGLEHMSALYKCSSCGEETRKVVRDKADDTIQCPKCNSQTKLQSKELLLDYLTDLARQSDIEVEIVSTDSVEGNQFFTGFGGIGAFLRYKTR